MTSRCFRVRLCVQRHQEIHISTWTHVVEHHAVIQLVYSRAILGLYEDVWWWYFHLFNLWHRWDFPSPTSRGGTLSRTRYTNIHRYVPSVGLTIVGSAFQKENMFFHLWCRNPHKPLSSLVIFHNGPKGEENVFSHKALNYRRHWSRVTVRLRDTRFFFMLCDTIIVGLITQTGHWRIHRNLIGTIYANVDQFKHRPLCKPTYSTGNMSWERWRVNEEILFIICLRIFVIFLSV